MKKFFNKILALLIALMISFNSIPVLAGTLSSQGSLYEGNYCFDEQTGTLTLEGKTINLGSESPFKDNLNIKKIVIDNNVENIFNYDLFDGCDNVTELTIGEKYKYELTFLSYLPNLEKITVNTINAKSEENFFIDVNRLSKLKEVVISQKTQYLGYGFLIDSSALEGNITTSSCQIKELVVPASVTEIENLAICLPSLEKVTIENPDCIIEDETWEFGSLYGLAISNGVASWNENENGDIASGFYNGTIYGYGGDTTAKQYCDKNNYNYVDLSAHNWQFVEKVEPTCTSKGYDLYECTDADCNETKKDNYTEMLEHQLIEREFVEPTCTGQGYTLFQCSVCGIEIKDNYLEKTEHQYDIIESYDDNYEYRVCSNCGLKTKIKHNLTSDKSSFTQKVKIDNEQVECTVVVDEQKCSSCEYSKIDATLYDKYEGENYIPIEARSWQLKDFTPATCTSVAIYHFYNQNETTTDLIVEGNKKLNHDYELIKHGEESSLYVCSRCGEEHIQPLLTNKIVFTADFSTGLHAGGNENWGRICNYMDDIVINVKINGTDVTLKGTNETGYEITYQSTLMNDEICFNLGSDNYSLYNVKDNGNNLEYKIKNSSYFVTVSTEYFSDYQVQNNIGHSVFIFIQPKPVEVTLELYDTQNTLLFKNTESFLMGAECSMLHPMSYQSEYNLNDIYAVLDVDLQNFNGTNVSFDIDKFVYTANGGMQWIGNFTLGNRNPTIKVKLISTTKDMQVVTQYLDTEGNVIADSDIQFYKAFDTYTTSAKDIEGYTLTSVPEESTGVVKSEVIEVDYIYEEKATETTQPNNTDEKPSNYNNREPNTTPIKPVANTIDTGDHSEYISILLCLFATIFLGFIYLLIKKKTIRKGDNNDTFNEGN